MTTTTVLPGAFADLEPLACEWSLPTQLDRIGKRQSSSYEQVKAFYDAIQLRAEEILTYLETKTVEDLDDGERRLLDLILSLAEVAPAVERFGEAKVPYGFDQMRFLPIHLAHLDPE